MNIGKHTALVLFVAGYFLTTSAAYAASPQYPTAAGQPSATAKGTQEQHPVIREAIRQLEKVKSELQNQAAHDFQGHRENAIQHVDQAIKELNLALQSDKR